MINPQAKLINCTVCGRDTKAKYGVCGRCTGEGPGKKFGGEEQIGRKARSSQVIGGSPIEDNDDDLPMDRTADREYHGSSERDDL